MCHTAEKKVEKVKEDMKEDVKTVPMELPEKAETQSDSVMAVHSEVDKHIGDSDQAQRKHIVEEAVAVVAQTKEALSLLDSKDNEKALEVLAEITGKLELLIARHPEMALAPIDVRRSMHDLFASPDTIRDLVDEAQYALKHYQVQRACKLLSGLKSEVTISTTHLPLASYPDAIKSVAPLIEAGKTDEAKSTLQAALSTLVETQKIIPLPVLRSELMLKEAEALAEKKDRSKEEDQQLATYLAEVRNQLEIAEVLGYGKKKDFSPLFTEIKEIQKKAQGDDHGKGWFEKIKSQMSDMFSSKSK